MATTDAEIKLQVLLQVLEAIAFLALACYCLTRRRAGNWAVLGAGGAALLGLASGLLAASSFELVFMETFHIADKILIRNHVNTVLGLASAAGAVMLAVAFVLLGRTAAGAARGPSYGP